MGGGEGVEVEHEFAKKPSCMFLEMKVASSPDNQCNIVKWLFMQ